MDAKKMGAFIAQCRKQGGMTQSGLAGKLHVTDKAVSRWERGIGFPDINTIEPLADALGVSVLELMRSDKSEDGQYSEKDVINFMKSTAEVAMKNRKQELTATVLAAFTTIVVGVISWIAGFGNLGGSVFIGAMAAAAETGIYFYMDGRDEAGGRKVYAVISCIAIVVIGFLMAGFWVSRH